MKISYASAACGSGKTHQIVSRACELARRADNVLIIQPTKQLIDKTVERELLNRSGPPTHMVFHGDKFPGRVAKEFMDWLKAFGCGGGHVVFITHQLLPHIPYFPDKRNWHVVVDEVPQVHDHHLLTIPRSHSILTDHLRLEPYNAIYSRLVCGNAKAITDIAQNKDKDELFELLSQAARDVKNPNWDCHVNAEKFNRLLRGEVKDLDIYTVLSPALLHGFRSVFIASANIEDTILYHLWGRRGVEFTEDMDFTRSLRFEHHLNGERIKIFYAIDENWSRQRQRDTWSECRNHTTLELIAQSATEVLGDKPFVWQANKTDTKGLRPLFGGNVELPHLPHGLNDYSHINNVILLTASNLTPDQYRFLTNQGMDGEQVRRAIYFQNAYQTVLRTSIRDPNNHELKRIVVPDLPVAQHLQEAFPGSTVERLPTTIPGRQVKVGRPPKHRTDQERKARNRGAKRLVSMRSLLHLSNSGPYVDGETLYVQNRRDETPIDILTEFRPSGSYFGTLFTNKYTTTSLYLIGTNTDEFIDWLEHLANREVPEKESNQLISPAIFDPRHPNREGTKRRGLGNIDHVRHLWLDFENGDLAPDELPKLFPNIRMVVTNSYHHHTSRPRFHVFIPVRQPLTPDAYEVLWDMIADKIQHAGYEVTKPRSNKGQTRELPRSGLDRGKKTPSSLFYLPCRARDPSESFFVDYRDEGRAILDPEVWFGNSVVPFRRPPPAPPVNSSEKHGELNNDLVEAATRDWRESPFHEGEGNKRLWDYAVKLRAAGLSHNDIEAMLYGEAAFARHPDQRLAQIPSIMNTLKASWRKAG